MLAGPKHVRFVHILNIKVSIKALAKFRGVKLPQTTALDDTAPLLMLSRQSTKRNARSPTGPEACVMV